MAAVPAQLVRKFVYCERSEPGLAIPRQGWASERLLDAVTLGVVLAEPEDLAFWSVDAA